MSYPTNRFLFFVLILLLLVNNLVAQIFRHGTVLLAIKTDTALVVGCDSRSISDWTRFVHGKQEVKHDTTSICKIRNIGSLYWVMSGFTNNFLYRIQSEAAYQTGQIEPAARVCSRQVHDYLVHVIDSLRIHNPGYYDQFYDQHAVNISKTIFFGIQDGKYLLNTHEYYFTSKKDEPTTIGVDETPDSDYKPNDTYLVAIATGSAFRNLQHHTDSLKYYLSHYSIDSIVKVFLQKEIDVNPECGGPIDVVLFDAHGVQWCVPKRDCH